MIHTLGMVNLEDRHSGKFVASKVISTLDRYLIGLNQILVNTTDNAKNMIKTVEVLNEKVEEFDDPDHEHWDEMLSSCCEELQSMGSQKWKIYHFGCAAHVLQLAVNDALKPYQTPIGHIRKFSKDLRAPNMRLKMKRLNKPVPPLDVVTRWGSTYIMINAVKGLF